MSPLAEVEVRFAIKRPGADKAPGPDGFPNRVLQGLEELLTPRLTALFNECLTAGLCPDHFRVVKTIALRKPGKDDYSKPKAYRRIALLNTMGKVLEACVAVRLSYFAEQYHLLPENHYGGRKGQGTETALYAMIETIKTAWKQGKIATALFLGISGAFDNVSLARLLHNLKRRGVPTRLVNWIASFLQDRYTTLELPDYHRPKAKVNTGIPQGSPLSPILYLFYNADLVGSSPSNIGYIDDSTMVAQGTTEEENCRSLALRFTDTCEVWSRTHASVFAPEKFTLVHFRPPATGRRREPVVQAPDDATLDLGGGRIVNPSESAKLLGVILDQHLNFEEHMKSVD